MRQYRVLLSVLAIVFVSGALLTPAAFAAKEEVAPEYGRCIKVAAGAGEYSNAKCTTLGGTEKYKWEPFSSITHRGFTIENKAGKSMTLETVTKLAIVCTGAIGSGKYTGPRTVGAVVFTFTGCKDESTAATCATAGAASGEIVTSVLVGELGIETLAEAGAASNAVGLELHSATGKAFTEFECGATKLVVTGSVIHPVDTNAMKAETTDEGFKASKGKQIPEHFEAAGARVAELGMSDGSEELQTGLSLTQVVQNEDGEKVEARSISSGVGKCERECIFVAQTGKGSESGEGSCSNAHPASWVNEVANYNDSTHVEGKISRGVTIAVCGTLEKLDTQQLVGTSAEPITIQFQDEAKIAPKNCAAQASNSCLQIGSLSTYVAVTSVSGYKGQIEDTERSYEHEKGEGEAMQAILALACTHCQFDNLEVGPLYISEKGDVVGNTEIKGITLRGESHPLEYDTLARDYFHDMGWAINFTNEEASGHLYIEYDTFYHLTHGLAVGGGNGTSSSIGEEVFAHNRFYGNSNWEDGEADTDHVDGIHCFAKPEKPAHYTGLFIYDNYIKTEGANTTSPIFVEGTNAGTPCSDKTSKIWVFNNVLSGNTCCGLASINTGEPRIFNNTLIGYGPSATYGKEETCADWNGDTKGEKQEAGVQLQNIRYKNNITASCEDLISAQKELLESGAVAHNLWANASAGNEVFACHKGAVGEESEKESWHATELTNWITCVAGSATESAYEAKAKIKDELASEGTAEGPEGEPEAGSYAIGHGANLTSLCKETPEESLCKNILGEARPSSGAWTIGAY
jgi:hypothetical protein